MSSPMTQRMVRDLNQPDAYPARPARCAWHLRDAGATYVRTCKRNAKLQVLVDGQPDYYGGGFCRQHARMAEDRSAARVMSSQRVTIEEVQR